MEISRQRIGQSIYETFYNKCDCCDGGGFKKTKSIIIYDIISKIKGINAIDNKDDVEINIDSNFEYIEITEELKPIRGGLHWVKTFKVEEVLNKNLNEGDGLVIIDADALIIDKEKNFLPPNNKSFAYSIDTGNTHCFGFLSMIKNDWTVNLFKLLHDQDRYDSLIDEISYHEGKKTYSSHWREFNEQASWYSLAGIKRHSNVPFWDLPNNGWHSNVIDCVQGR